MISLKVVPESFVQYTNLVIVLLLPIFPHYEHGNFIVPLLFAISLATVFYSRQRILKEFRLIDLGFFLLLVSTLISFISEFLNGFRIPAFSGYTNMFLVGILYFSMTDSGKSRPISNLGINIIFTVLAIMVLYIFCAAASYEFNFAVLSSKTTYYKGIGNVSQLAMYCSFYVILIFHYEELHRVRLFITAILAITAALILESKLLFLVTGVLILNQFIENWRPLYRLSLFLIICFTGFFSALFFSVRGVDGRIDLAAIVLSNYNFFNFTGIRIDGFSQYINELFFSQVVVNNIGEVNNICFNDFVQTFVELGYLGLAGLLIIFMDIINNKSYYKIFALFLVLFFMFPLRYPETGYLFALTVSAYKNSSKSVFKNMLFDSAKIKFLYVAIVAGVLPYSIYNTIIHARWTFANQKIEHQKKQNEGLSEYKSLSGFFESNAEFHLQYGIHLSNNNEYNNALRELKKSNSLNKSYDSFAAIGDCYFQLSYYKEAYEQYELSKRLRPDYIYPVYRMIYCLINMGKKEEATSLWENVKAQYEKNKNLSIRVMIAEIESIL